MRFGPIEQADLDNFVDEVSREIDRLIDSIPEPNDCDCEIKLSDIEADIWQLQDTVKGIAEGLKALMEHLGVE